MNSLNPNFFNDPLNIPVFSNENRESDSNINNEKSESSNINALRKNLMTNMHNKPQPKREQNPIMDDIPFSFPWMQNQDECKNCYDDNCHHDCDDNCMNDHKNHCKHDWDNNCNDNHDNHCKHDCDDHCKPCCNMDIAIANIPSQCFNNLYNTHEAFCAGTLFRVLDLPFTGSRCNHK